MGKHRCRPPFLGRTNNKYITHISSPCSSVSASQDAGREITEEIGNCRLVAWEIPRSIADRGGRSVDAGHR